MKWENSERVKHPLCLLSHRVGKALEVFYEKKILQPKEEADSSQTNQAFDQAVAKQDKAGARFLLNMLPRGVMGAVVSQWDLVNIGLAIVKNCTAESWISSFKRVNMHPDYRVPFVGWCGKIKHFLEAGATFKEEAALDTFSLLPTFWQNTEPSDRRKTIEIIDRHNADWSVPLLQELTKTLGFNREELGKILQVVF